MGLDQKTKVIDGHTWVVTQFPARAGNKYKVRILKMVGPAISELLPAIGSLADAAKIAENPDAGSAMVAAFPQVVSSLAQHVDEDVLADTMVELMAMSTRDSVAVTPELFDIEFAGNDSELNQALWFILQVNYPDFIEMVGSRTGLNLKASPPESPEK